MRDSKLQRALEALLSALALGAPITVGLKIIPGIVARRHFRDFEEIIRRDRPLARRALTYARGKGYLDISSVADVPVFSLTRRGKKRLIRFRADDLRLHRPSSWDQKWRMVIFDIPSAHKTARDLLRGRLKQLGFVQVQDSAWVTPYPSYREVQFVVELYGLRSFVRFLVVKEIDRDQDLRTHFGL
jgi:DNA-binding transcriptional regulator PaaX